MKHMQNKQLCSETKLNWIFRFWGFFIFKLQRLAYDYWEVVLFLFLNMGLGLPADQHFLFFKHSKVPMLTVDLSSDFCILLGAEKSNSPGAQGVIKVLLHAFLAPSKRRKKKQSHVGKKKNTWQTSRDNIYVANKGRASKYSGICSEVWLCGIFEMLNSSALVNHLLVIIYLKEGCTLKTAILDWETSVNVVTRSNSKMYSLLLASSVCELKGQDVVSRGH